MTDSESKGCPAWLGWILWLMIVFIAMLSVWSLDQNRRFNKQLEEIRKELEAKP